ncbi:MAG: chitin disaccharide deacetylase [Spirochaetaceae bacterium]|jgi:predicted glycoside hydrolase/deacetylase ChbG (UPF0249 family)|nr:chitin disaccharide deacetylase [Spirochaetaceae bacterium]
MKLIVNADDFGISEAVNLGIVKSFKDGVVRSTTMMANMPGFDHAATLAKKYDGLGVGIHLVMTAGEPLTGRLKTLTGEDGKFLKQGDFFEKVKNNQVDYSEMEKELRAQLKRIVDAGVKLTHFDSHHHFHLQKGPFDVVKKLADECGLPVRVGTKEEFARQYPGLRSTERFNMDFYGVNLTVDSFIAILEKYKDAESLEIMAHPAYLDKTIIGLSSYNTARTNELDILTSKKVLDYIKTNNIILKNFQDYK